MRKYILIGAILVNGGALSQEVKTYNLTVTQQDIAIIAQALGERPYKEAAPLIAKLDAQLRPQDKPAEPKPAEPAAEPNK